MTVFSNSQRTDRSPARHAESSSEFYERAAGSFWQEVRNLVEAWFERLPADAQADVGSRLRSKNDAQFRGAFLELYLHELLISSGFTVSTHPDVPGSKRHPDFLADNGTESFYVEARSISPKASEVAAELRRATIHDSLNDLDSPNFFLDFEVESPGASNPSIKLLARDLRKWLTTLDPDAVAAAINAAGLAVFPQFSWVQDGWHLSFRALPKSPESRGSDKGLRTVGLSGVRAYLVDDATRMRRALEDKGSAYGTPDRPYVVAVALDAWADRDWDVMGALYGDDQLLVTDGADGALQTRRSRGANGYWTGGGVLRRSHVSGLLVVPHLSPHAIPKVVPTIWHHPSPTFRAPALSIWRSAEVVSDQIHFEEPSIAPKDVFRLPDPWPQGMPFGN
jgi:hypothetical protein